MAPPPRMKDLFVPPEPADTPVNRFDFNRGDRSESIVRNVQPEDPYDDRPYMAQSHNMRGGYIPTYPPPSLSSSSSRQISQTSSTGTGGTMQSGSENWETFSERSDDPPESDVDFQNYRQRQMKRFTPDGGHVASPRGVQGKKMRSGIRNVDGGDLMMEQHDGRMVRVIEGSEAGWTDEGDY
jgi:protein regulator of cytokinesis 1